MNTDEPVLAELIKIDESSANEMILKMVRDQNKNNDVIKCIKLYSTCGDIREFEIEYDKYKYYNYSRRLKTKHGYLHFEYNVDYDMYISYMSLINTFLKNNPSYRSVGDSFVLNIGCLTTDVLYLFIYEPLLI